MDANVDLNRIPPYLNLRSTLNIRVVVKTKLNCRQILIDKYGEDAYSAIIASPEPLILYRYSNDQVSIFVIVS